MSITEVLLLQLRQRIRVPPLQFRDHHVVIHQRISQTLGACRQHGQSLGLRARLLGLLDQAICTQPQAVGQQVPQRGHLALVLLILTMLIPLDRAALGAKHLNRTGVETRIISPTLVKQLA